MSKKVFIAEVLLISIPLTILFITSAVLTINAQIIGSEWSFMQTITQLLLICIFFLAFYTLAYKFIRYDSDVLREANNLYWFFLKLGIIFSLIGLIPLFAIIFNFSEVLLLFGFFKFGAFGLVLIPSAIHLLVLRKTVNKTPILRKPIQ